MLQTTMTKQYRSDLVSSFNSHHVKDADCTALALLERHAVLQSPSRIEELVHIFIHATKVNKIREKPTKADC